MTNGEAIYELENISRGQDYPEPLEALDIAIAAIREKEARENPQPLTLDELRRRVGKPVYSVMKPTVYAWRSEWGILDEVFDHGEIHIRLRNGCMRIGNSDCFGETWAVYDYKPNDKEADNA